ncbi:MarR family winged helix-turn-helix transcriptional regulator [Brevibacillus fluminis]|nr:MarR family winged helix-turn-helix transcriptional regulator [Brevibacillus fluminis]
MTVPGDMAALISHGFSEIYYHCHPPFTVPLTHQAVRALQFIGMNGVVTVSDVAQHLSCAHNTASEVLRRLDEKGLVSRQRSREDERTVQISLTESGHHSLAEHTGLDTEKLAHCLNKMSVDEREQVANGFEILRKFMKSVGEE